MCDTFIPQSYVLYKIIILTQYAGVTYQSPGKTTGVAPGVSWADPVCRYQDSRYNQMVRWADATIISTRNANWPQEKPAASSSNFWVLPWTCILATSMRRVLNIKARSYVNKRTG